MTKENEKRDSRDFRTFLQSEFIRRCKVHPGYSLRKFARYLQVDSAYLSRILNAKRKITKKNMLALAQRLELSPNEVREFLNIEVASKRTKPSESKYQTAPDNYYNILSNWYFPAILELIHTIDFQADPKWISKKLGITITETTIAIEKLIDSGYLKIAPDGTWFSTYEFVEKFSDGFTSSATRSLQKQFLRKAISSLDDVPVQYRSQRSMTFSGSIQQIQQAKKKIAEFLEELSDLMQESDSKEAVFQLSASLFPLSKIGEEYQQLLGR